MPSAKCRWLFTKKMNTRFKFATIPLSANELESLTKSIKSEGCREAITLWEDSVIDGHNRLKICQEYGIPFKTEEIEFNNDDEAILWIVKHQFKRRQSTPFQRCEMILKLFPRMSLQDMADLANVSKSAIFKTRKILKDCGNISTAHPNSMNLTNIDEAVKCLIDFAFSEELVLKKLRSISEMIGREFS